MSSLSLSRRFPATQAFWRAVMVLAMLAGLAAHAGAAPYYAVTIQPLRMIVGELTAGRADVIAIIPPGASPHTYEPRPSDLRTAREAKYFFSVSEHLDAWAAKLPNNGTARVIDLLPVEVRQFFPEGQEEHEHGHAHDGVVDPHFWTDPLTVAALLPPLTAKLCKIDPEGAATYHANEAKFAARLQSLNAEMKAQLAPMRGREVFLFHPSFLYLLKRYGLTYAGSIEDIPGKEGSPAHMIAIIEAVKEKNIPAIFTEPQLPRAPAEVIAEAAGVTLAELDPNGGVPGLMSYEDWLRHNVSALVAAYSQP